MILNNCRIFRKRNRRDQPFTTYDLIRLSLSYLTCTHECIGSESWVIGLGLSASSFTVYRRCQNNVLYGVIGQITTNAHSTTHDNGPRKTTRGRNLTKCVKSQVSTGNRTQGLWRTVPASTHRAAKTRYSDFHTPGYPVTETQSIE